MISSHHCALGVTVERLCSFPSEIWDDESMTQPLSELLLDSPEFSRSCVSACAWLTSSGIRRRRALMNQLLICNTYQHTTWYVEQMSRCLLESLQDLYDYIAFASHPQLGMGAQGAPKTMPLGCP